MTERKPYQPPKTIADRIGGLIDRAVSMVSPERGVRRLAFRAIVNASRHREHIRNAASESGESTQTRNGKWLGSRLSPDSAIEMDAEQRRTRSRELYVNDSIGGAVDARVNLVVSYGFTPQARIRERPGIVTKEQAKKYNAELEEVFERISPRISKNGKQSLWQLARLAERHHGVDGESFTILSDRSSVDNPIPLVLEVVDPERVQTPTKEINNPRIRMGVEHDAKGRIVAYHIRDTHPGDTLEVNEKFTRYEADRVLHVFEPWFAGQTRAFPWLTRVLNLCKDKKDLGEAAIIAEQVRACFAAFVTNPAGGPLSAAGAASETVGSVRYEDIRPGTIRHGGDVGETITFSQPSQSGGYAEIQGSTQHEISAGINWPFEMLAKNWSGTSFAGGRLSLTDCKLFVKSQQKLLDESWLRQIWNRIVYESVLVGACSISPRVYNNARWCFERHEWRAPAWPYAITPREEVDAVIKKVDNNLCTKASAIGEFGGDLEEVFEERQRERQMEREMEIEPATAEVPDATLEPQVAEQVAA